MESGREQAAAPAVAAHEAVWGLEGGEAEGRSRQPARGGLGDKEGSAAVVPPGTPLRDLDAAWADGMGNRWTAASHAPPWGLQMKRSTVVGAGGKSVEDNYRTSYGTFLRRCVTTKKGGQ